jgi:WD40 repeat protein
MQSPLATLVSALRRAADFLFGYDFFISYSHGDGMNYPRRLSERLEALNYKVFLDTKVYVAGTDLQLATRRRIRMSKKLIVVVRKNALESDWVLKEVKTCLDRGRAPIAIDVNKTLESSPPKQPLASHLKDKIYIPESIADSDGEPSDAVIQELTRSFRATRQDTLRLRVMSVAALVFLVVAVVAVWQGWIAEQRRLHAVSRQLATQARYEINDRLDTAMLLAAGANRSVQTFESRDVLLRALQRSPRLLQYLHSDQPGWRVIDLKPDGSQFVSAGADRYIFLWDIAARAISPLELGENPSPVSSIAISPDGTVVVAGGEDGVLYFWDVASKKLKAKTSHKHPEAVASLIFSPDGQTLVSGSGLNSVISWDVSNAERLHSYPGLKSAVYASAIDAEGELLATAAEDGVILLWDLQTGNKLSRLQSPEPGYVYSLAFTPDGEGLIAAGESGALRLWGQKQEKWYSTAREGHNAPVRGLLFDPIGQQLASADTDGNIYIWSAQWKQKQPKAGPLYGHARLVTDLAFMPQGKQLISAGEAPYLVRWDTTDSEPLLGRRLSGIPRVLSKLDLSPDGNTLAVTACAEPISKKPCKAYVLRLLAINDGLKEETQIPIGSGRPIYVHYNRNGKLLTTLDAEGAVSWWNVKSKQRVRHVPSPKQTSVPSAAPDDAKPQKVRYRAIPSYRSAVNKTSDAASPIPAVLSKVASGAPCSLKYLNISTVAISGDTNTLAVGNSRGCIFVWSEKGGWRPKPLIGHKGGIMAMAISPKGDQLASTADDGAIVIWDLKRLEPINRWPISKNAKLRALEYSPDGKRLSVGGGLLIYSDEKRFIEKFVEEGQVYHLDLELMPYKLRGPEKAPGPVHSLSYSRNGALLAMGGCSEMGLWCVRGFISLFDTITEQPLGETIYAHNTSVNRLLFASDGEILLSLNNNITMQVDDPIVWDLRTDSWIDKACAVATRDFSRAERLRYFGNTGSEPPCRNR